jgi:hypothetical protein
MVILVEQHKITTKEIMMTAKTNTRTRKANTAKREQYLQKINAIQANLSEWRDQYSDEEIAQLTAEIQGYSLRNTMLIAMQCPTATTVRGYHAWQDLGRMVNKDEKGIAILAPAGSKTVDADQPATTEGDSVTSDDGQHTRKFFRLAYVFDIAQTSPVTK